MKLAITLIVVILLSGCQTASRRPHLDGPGSMYQGGYIINYNGCTVSADLFTPGDPRIHYKSSIMGRATHGALDIPLPIGVPIIAPAPGWVVSVDVPPPTSPRHIEIRMKHSFGRTMYVHLSKIEVKQGDSVKRGQLIGWSGNTGAVDKYYPHMHFGIRGSDRDVLNGHDLWYRTEAEKKANPWHITVPMYDPSITYPRDALTFPVDCAELAKISAALYKKMKDDADSRIVRKSKRPRRRTQEERRREMECAWDSTKCEN